MTVSRLYSAHHWNSLPVSSSSRTEMDENIQNNIRIDHDIPPVRLSEQRQSATWTGAVLVTASAAQDGVGVSLRCLLHLEPWYT